MNPMIHVAGWTLVHFAWQGALIALIAASVLRLVQGASSHARYAFACATLAAMLVSPLVTARLLLGDVPLPSRQVLQDVRLRVIGLATSIPSRSDALEPSSLATSSPLPRIDTVLPIIVMIWLVGVVSLLIRLAGGWWRIRNIHRASLEMTASCSLATSQQIARRLGIKRGIHVVDSLLVHTPTVVGWLRPVILLPIAALANLTPGQVDAILAHELAHIRRHDFLVNLLQTVAETLLFYHPAVWWVSSRIRIEREHCCDEVAVDVCGDAVGYAAALTELEAWRTEHSAFALAATGGSLLERVRRVLGARGGETRRAGSATMVAALVLLFLLAAGTLQLIFARQPSGALTTASQDDKSLDPRAAVAWKMVFDHPTGEMTFRGFTGRELIRFAYQLPGSRILGGPDWIDTETFDLSTTLASAPGADEMPGVVRDLLEERFGLIAHEETRGFPVYALVIDRADGSLGPNLQPSTSDCLGQRAWMKAGAPPLHQAGQRTRFCGVWDNGPNGVSVEQVTMEDLAQYLSRPGPALDRPVVDRTGLQGTFDLSLDVFLPAAALMGQYPKTTAVLEPLGLRSLHTVLREQLGLRLDRATAPAEVIVIDRAERPNLSLAGARAASQRSNATVYKAGDGVVLPVPLRKVDPEYPSSAQQARIQGTVTITTIVLTDGSVSDVRVTKPVNTLLDDEAVKAVRQWRFRPGTKDGKAVSVEVSIEMGFSLRGPTYKAGADGVSLPIPIKEVKPMYPEAEQNAGIQGVVTVEAVVMPDGTVGRTTVLASLDPALDEQALQAIKQWQFKPGTKEGQPVPVSVSVDMSFTLK